MSDGQVARLGIFGMIGSGKTTLAKKVALHQRRVLVWDAGGDYLEIPNQLTEIDDLADFLEETQQENFAAVAYCPQSADKEEFEEVCGLAFDYGRMLFVVEEVADNCGPSWLPPRFSKIVRLGRHRGLGLLWVTQRLNEINRTLTSQTHVFAGFRMTEPIDLSALAGRCGSEYADRVAKQPPFHWLGFDAVKRENFTDVKRLRALWGAPEKWGKRR